MSPLNVHPLVKAVPAEPATARAHPGSITRPAIGSKPRLSSELSPLSRNLLSSHWALSHLLRPSLLDRSSLIDGILKRSPVLSPGTSKPMDADISPENCCSIVPHFLLAITAKKLGLTSAFALKTPFLMSTVTNILPVPFFVPSFCVTSNSCSTPKVPSTKRCLHSNVPENFNPACPLHA